MAWTSPRTWVAGEKPTAATLNTHIRDNQKAIGDAWTAYGSGASWTAVSVNPAIGNGTWDAAYMAAGKLIEFRISITMGSTTTYGTGSWLVALPFAPGTGRWTFTGAFRDTSAGTTFPLFGEVSAGVVALRVLPNTAGNAFLAVSSTVPVTAANTDSLFLSGTYEAA